MKNKFGDVFLGFNFTTDDTDAPVKYSDGTAFNKSMDFAFDEDSEKFGNKDCAYLKKGVSFKPRDCDCSQLMEQLCQWNSKFDSLQRIKNFHINIRLNIRYT